MALKRSIYSSSFKLDNGFILFYSGMTDSFVALHSSCFDENGFPLNETTSETLQKIEVLVDENLDEVKHLKECIDEVDNDDTKFQPHINPTLDCNFKCWYCYETHEKGSKLSAETLESIKRLIDRIISEKHSLKEFHLSFFGGEPLLGFKNAALPLITYAGECCEKAGINFSVHFTSNGYLINDFIIDSLKKYQTSFQITLDGNREAHNKVRHTSAKKGSYDKILNNVARLVANGIFITLRINYTGETLGTVYEIIDSLDVIQCDSRKWIRVDLQRVWQDYNGKYHEESIKDTLKSLASKLCDKGFFNNINISRIHFKDSCYGDKKNYMLINYNGNVHFCTAREFNENNSVGKLLPTGEVKWKEGAVERRRNIKFYRTVCHDCRIAPLCAGGCRQKAIDNLDKDGCFYKYNDEDIDRIIINRFEQKQNEMQIYNSLL